MLKFGPSINTIWNVPLSSSILGQNSNNIVHKLETIDLKLITKFTSDSQIACSMESCVSSNNRKPVDYFVLLLSLIVPMYNP